MAQRLRQNYDVTVGWEEVPDVLGTEDPLYAEIEVTNTGDPLSGNMILASFAGAGVNWEAGSVTADAGETVVAPVTLSESAMDDLHDNQPGTYTFEVGIAGPGMPLITSQMEVVEGSVGNGEPSIDPDLVSVTGCGVTPGQVTQGDQFTLQATVENGNDAPVSLSVHWDVGDHTFNTDPTIPANDAVNVEVTFTLDSQHFDLVGGLGDHGVSAYLSNISAA